MFLEAEHYRVGNRILNFIFTLWIAVSLAIKRWRSYSVKNFIESVTEFTVDGKESVLFSTS